MGDGGGGHWLVRMEWCPAGWSVCLPLLICPCTIKSRSSLLAPAHPGGPGKRAVNGCNSVVVVAAACTQLTCSDRLAGNSDWVVVCEGTHQGSRQWQGSVTSCNHHRFNDHFPRGLLPLVLPGKHTCENHYHYSLLVHSLLSVHPPNLERYHTSLPGKNHLLLVIFICHTISYPYIIL